MRARFRTRALVPAGLDGQKVPEADVLVKLSETPPAKAARWDTSVAKRIGRRRVLGAATRSGFARAATSSDRFATAATGARRLGGRASCTTRECGTAGRRKVENSIATRNAHAEVGVPDVGDGDPKGGHCAPAHPFTSWVIPLLQRRN